MKAKVFAMTRAVGFGLLALPAVAAAASHTTITNLDLAGLGVGIFKGGTLLAALAGIIKTFLLVAGILAFLFVLYGGFIYLTAGGDSDKAGKGRTVIVNAIIGVLIIFLSFALVDFIIKKTQKSTLNIIGVN